MGKMDPEFRGGNPIFGRFGKDGLIFFENHVENAGKISVSKKTENFFT